MTPDELRSFTWYTGNLDWLPARTIFLGRAGSHAYGTNLPTSDLDLRGVCIAPKRYYVGMLDRFEQAESKSPDVTVFDIGKFFALAWENNPNVLELMWIHAGDWVIPTPPRSSRLAQAWYSVLAARNLFLSTKCLHTFSGYAHSQLNRIKTHRAWLLNPPKGAPRRSDFGLPEGAPTVGKEQLGIIESLIRKRSDVLGGQGFTKDLVEAHDEALVAGVVTELNLARDLMPVILAERRFAAASRTWAQYQTWKSERNKLRAELEAKHGYDTKHAMHLVRLLRMGTEILEGRGVIVKRPDAEELLAIRAGAWSFDYLMDWAKSQELRLHQAAEVTTLPRAPDRKTLNELLIELREANP